MVGYPVLREGRRHSAAGIFHQGRQVAEYLKAELPDYGVFDETRYFQPQADATVFTVAGVRCALLICEDTWLPAAPARARTAGAELVLSLNASPFQSAKGDLRADTLRSNVCAQGMAVVACNLVGGQDELVFEVELIIPAALADRCYQIKLLYHSLHKKYPDFAQYEF